MFKDSLFNKIEKKTNINKDTIISLANKLQRNNLKDEKTIREVIHELTNLTGKNISEEKENKIVKAIMEDKVPSNVDKMF